MLAPNETRINRASLAQHMRRTTTSEGTHGKGMAAAAEENGSGKDAGTITKKKSRRRLADFKEIDDKGEKKDL